MKKSNKGFTLVELIVVIAIIGILAAILVPAMIGYITDSKLSSANSSAKQVYTAINNYCEKVVSNLAPIKDGTSGVMEVSKKSDPWVMEANSETATVPTKAPGTNNTPDEWANYIADAVAFSMGDEAAGSVFMCEFTSGFPTTIIWAKNENDPYVGGYPKQATEKYWTIAAAKSGDADDAANAESNALAGTKVTKKADPAPAPAE